MRLISVQRVIGIFLSAVFACIFSIVIPQAVVAQEAASSEAQSTASTSKEETDKIKKPNLSEKIPVNSIFDSWEKIYLETMKKLGLDKSLNTRLLTTAIIALITIGGGFIARKLTLLIRNRLLNFAVHFRITADKMDFYYKFIYALFVALITIAALSALTITWNVSLDKYISTEFLMAAFARTLTVYFIILGGAIFIEVVSGLLEIAFLRWGNSSQSRIDTLLPIARNTVYIVFFTIFTLMLLSEIGIDVMPLLAGAGVLGVAIGFGAQTIIKDLLTGFIIILEDLIQVGDVATLASKTGVIEKITIRKVQLRNLDGTVYTVPFGEITVVENLTKEFSCAVFDIGISYREDFETVVILLKKIDDEMREDEIFKHMILEPLEIFGLDRFADSAVIIKARIKTVRMQQWNVSREFNKRMKKIFDAEGIEIPFPNRTIHITDDKSNQLEKLKEMVAPVKGKE
ncbi:MAG: mechanosensitive ion channel family protein [Pseudomonadota bacterium]